MYEIEAIMSRDVVSVRRDAPIARVIELLAANDISGIPVVDGADRLVGIVTEKDVMTLESCPESPAGKVEDCMTEDIVSFNVQDDLIAVCECLVKNRFRRVPILREGHLVGIISRRDLIKYIMEPISS